jgi:hypothetical protein
MKKLLLFSLIGVSSIFTSCKITRNNILSTPGRAPELEIASLRAEVDVDMSKKLEGSAQSTYFLFFRISGDNKFLDGMEYSSGSSTDRVGRTKSLAAYNAVKDTDADIIVHPTYSVEIEKSLFFKKIKTTVKGYKGVFTDFYQKEYCDDCKATINGTLEINKLTK